VPNSIAGAPAMTVASASPPRSRGVIGRLFSGGLFGYAEAGEKVISQAHAAANAMADGTLASGALADWREGADVDARALDVRLGVFTDAGKARAVSLAFARIGAVRLDRAELGGMPATDVRLDMLKPGATRADVLSLAAELGLNDIVLY